MSNRLTTVEVVSESMVHIIEPVADQTVRFILQKLGLIDLMQDQIQIVSDFRDTSKTLDENSNPKLIDYRCIAKVTPTVNPSNIKWEGSKTVADLGNGQILVRQEKGKYQKRPWSGRDLVDREYAIFHNDDAYIDMTEWCIGSSMQIEMRLDFHDLTPAQEALSTVFAVFNAGDMINYLPLQYDYPIPKPQKEILKYLYTLSGFSEKLTHDGFKQWLHKYSKGILCWNVNRNDLRAQELIALKNNSHALYLIECTQDAPEVGNARFTITLNVSVQYSRVNRVVLDYPIVVNNNVVNHKYVPMDAKVREYNQGAFQWQNIWVDKLWHKVFASRNPKMLKYPWWDPWEVPGNSGVSLRGFKPIFSCAFTLDDADNPKGETVIDLVEGLPGYHLNDTLKKMLEDGGSKCLRNYNTYVNVAVYAHDFQVDPSLLEFDGRYLHVKSRTKKNIYRMVISCNPTPLNMGPININWVIIATLIPKRKKA